MGGGEIKELSKQSRGSTVTLVVATPIDIGRIMRLDKPAMRVSYEIEERSKPTIEEILSERLKQLPS